MNSSILNAYDPDRFRVEGHQLVDMLADYLTATISSGTSSNAFTWEAPNASFQKWEADFLARENSQPIDFFKAVVEGSVKLHHPNYMGHQIAPPAPVAVLGGFLSDFLNNGMGVYEMGVQSTVLERWVIKKFAEMMGLASATDGYLTSGGTLANMTALLAARSVKSSTDIWNEGSKNRLALMVSEEAHYCVDRAVRIMGWGEAGIIKVPADDQFRMRTELLPTLLREAHENGLQVIAVVGSACSTSTGSFDDLTAIGQFCRENQLWFHVDGAHGAAFALSSKYKHLVKGLEAADSIAMDFHKSLAVPALATALFFKNPASSYQTFRQKAEYLFKADQQEEEWYNLGRRTFECTKFMMSVKIYALVSTHGFGFFDDFTTRLIDLGQEFARIIQEDPAFELAVMPACNIVCYRYLPPDQSEEEINLVNEDIRQQLLEDGQFYIVKTKLRGKVWLRSTITNPFTDVPNFKNLLEQIKKCSNKPILLHSK